MFEGFTAGARRAAVLAREETRMLHRQRIRDVERRTALRLASRRGTNHEQAEALRDVRRAIAKTKAALDRAAR
jgi:hypothetical protein